ncbi:DUF4199 domain-containing protein [Pedobacter sp. AW1-32]|uniref:DUF4199 domain-containing protein n=1 Tax=Pedobacter sp. AW1-32 TaxID=3383026 RepID=UPI003FEE805B
MEEQNITTGAFTEGNPVLQQDKKPNALAFKVAISFAVYTLATFYLYKFLGIDAANPDMPVAEKIISMVLSYGIFILAIVYTQITHKRELGGYITYGRAFSTGFKVAAYAGLFIGLLFILYYKVLDTAAMDHIVDASIAQAKGNEQQIEGIRKMSGFMWIFAAFGAAITYTIFGLIVSLISAAVIKKDVKL